MKQFKEKIQLINKEQVPEEGQGAQQLKCWDNNNKNEDITPSVNNVNKQIIKDTKVGTSTEFSIPKV